MPKRSEDLARLDTKLSCGLASRSFRHGQAPRPLTVALGGPKMEAEHLAIASASRWESKIALSRSR
jgi:hypothetical protein